VDGAGNVRYYLADHLGSTRGLADAAGNITDSYSYDPYGQRTAVTGSLADTPFGYAGQYTDLETGFQYLRARYYDPATGQFLTVDPLVDVTGKPYAYAVDNPLNATDPWGLANCWDPRNFASCGGSAAQAAGDAANVPFQAGLAAVNRTPVGHQMLLAVTALNGSDTSGAVNEDVAALFATPQTLLNLCVENAGACAQAAVAPSFFLLQHGPAIIGALGAGELANLQRYRRDIECGHYGSLGGHALVDFVKLFGPGRLSKLGGIPEVPGGSP